MHNDEKLKRFEDLMMGKAQKKRDTILAEVERYKEQELDKIKDKILEDSYAKIKSDIDMINQDATMTVSQKTLELKRELFSTRDEYERILFTETAERIKAFAATESYKAYLLGCVAQIDEQLRKADTILYLRPADLSYADEVKAAFGVDCTVATDEEIELGGIIAQNKRDGFLADLSLDTKLSEQRSWFRQHSGFLVN